MKNDRSVNIDTIRCLTLIIAGLCLITMTAMPVMAGVKYIAGNPELSATISGTNEYIPGEDATIEIKIQNSGLNTMKTVESGIVDRDDLPTTAKMVTATLLPDGAPVLIKSDSQMIGDIGGSAMVPVSFQVLVKDDATAGSYELPLRLQYTYLSNAEQLGTDSISSTYKKEDVTVTVPFVIKSAINLNVTKVVSDEINAGGEGYVTITLKNDGKTTGHKAIAKLNRSGSSPIIPVDSTVYIGEFAPLSEVSVKFKISVSSDGEAQEYPLEIEVDYENDDGEKLSSISKRFGVPVDEKISFLITSETPVMTPGEKKVLEITYRNEANTTAYGVESRLSAVGSFSSKDDLAYLGDMKSGESAVARYEVSLSSEAVDKTYALDSEVRYKDVHDNTHISDTIKVEVNVVKNQSSGMTPILILIVVIIIAGGAFYFYKQKKQN